MTPRSRYSVQYYRVWLLGTGLHSIDTRYRTVQYRYRYQVQYRGVQVQRRGGGGDGRDTTALVLMASWREIEQPSADDLGCSLVLGAKQNKTSDF